MERLEEFLKETYYCDFSHPAIQKIAQEFKTRFTSKKELAKALFYFVRDGTVYHVGNWRKRASETLKEGSGNCTNAANLFVALCRVVGIPAGYGFMEVVAPDYFGPIAHPKLAQAVEKRSRRSKHIYAYVYLTPRWIKVDPSDDEPLSMSTQHLNPQSKLVNWDGTSDAMLNFDKSHILNDSGPVANIDHIIGKKQRRKIIIPVYIANLYLDFLRIRCKYIDAVNKLEQEFLRWLRYHRPLDYLLTRSYFYLLDFVNKFKR